MKTSKELWQDYDRKIEDIIASCNREGRHMMNADETYLLLTMAKEARLAYSRECCQHQGKPILEGWGQGDDEHHRFICPTCGAELPEPEFTGQVTEIP
jgi:hypothetical protein